MIDDTKNVITDEDRKVYGDLEKLARGNRSDREIAANIVWLNRHDLDFMPVIYSARDRIMHLAVKVHDLEQELAKAKGEIGEVTRPYGNCAITGPKEDIAFIFKHLPDINDVEIKPVQRYVQVGSAMYPTVSSGDWVASEDYDALASRISIWMAESTPMGEFLEKQDETEFLLSNPVNAKRLMESIAQFKGVELEGLTPFNHLNAASNVQSGVFSKAPHPIEVPSSNTTPGVAGYVMQARQVGGDKGFSWKEDDENFPREIWERKPVVYLEDSGPTLEDLLVMHRISVVYKVHVQTNGDCAYEWTATLHDRYGEQTITAIAYSPSEAVERAVAQRASTGEV